jgi:hypothetical protein
VPVLKLFEFLVASICMFMVGVEREGSGRNRRAGAGGRMCQALPVWSAHSSHSAARPPLTPLTPLTLLTPLAVLKVDDDGNPERRELDVFRLSAPEGTRK